MLNSTIFDVVIGLVATFLAVSLLASALTEALSTCLNWRSKTLLAGIKNLLNDQKLEGLALDLYNHALVNPFSDGNTRPGAAPKNQPSYIDSAHFAVALLDAVQQQRGAGPTVATAIANISDKQIKNTLTALYDRAGKLTSAFQNEVAHWFDTSMDRLSGDYKRRTKLCTFLLALLASGLLNADPVRIAATLWQRPALAAQLKKLQLPASIDPAKPEEQAQQLVAQIQGAGSFLGWSGMTVDLKEHPGAFCLMIMGWLVTAGGALFGAPFWFDLLQRFVQLRGTGQAINSTNKA